MPPTRYLERLDAKRRRPVSTTSSPHSTIRPTSQANAGALRAWSGRASPFPAGPTATTAGAAEALSESAARGRNLAQLLDSDAPVPGITEGALRPEAAAIAVPATTDGRNMAGDDFALTAGWGHFGTGDAVMPGQGRIVQRAYTPEERAASAGAAPILGETTYDIYLNAHAHTGATSPPASGPTS